MRRAYTTALVAFVVALPLLMAPTGGIPSKPRFTAVGVGAAPGAAGTITGGATLNLVATAVQANGSPLTSTLNGAADTAPIGWTRISKTATTSRNTTTTLTADPELQITPPSSTVRIEFCFIFNATTSGAGGYKFAINRLSAGSTFAQWWGSRASAGATAFFSGQGIAGPGTTTTLVTATATAVSSSRDYACGNGIIVGQGATYAIEWAQNSSDANNLNLLAGSWIRFQTVF